MWPTYVPLIVGLLTILGVIWRFAAVVTSLQGALNNLGGAIQDLKQQIGTFAKHGEILAEQNARINNVEHRMDRVEDRIEQ